MNKQLRLKPADFDAAIVDLDGTMIDTQGDFVAALNAMLAELALPPVDLGFVSVTVGKGSEYLVRRTLEHAGDVLNRYELGFDRYQHHYAGINGAHSDVFEGVDAGLQMLRGHGLRLACLTNKPGVFARPLLDKKGLGGYFAQVFGGDAFARKKPDPLPLLQTCKALGSTPARTLMVGDSSNDAEAARAAGCPVVLVSYGYNHGEPVHAVDCDGVVDRIDKIFG